MTKNLLAKVLPYWRQHGTTETVKQVRRVMRNEPRPPARGFPELAALRAYTVDGASKRVNIVTDTVSGSHLYGGVGTALILAALLAERRSCNLRVITRLHAPEEHRVFQILRDVADVNTLPNVEFHFADVFGSRVDLAIGEDDLFLTTSWWTTVATRQMVAPERIVYLLQEDERMFYPFGDDHLRCSELLADDSLAFVVNSQLLFEHLVAEGFTNIAKRGVFFEPSFPRSLFHREPRPARQKRRLLFYARPNNVRNLYYRGVEAIEAALDAGVIDPARWEIHFVGKEIPQVRFSATGIEPTYHEGLDWTKYAELVRSVDLGLSLMYTPHPSYPPLDLAASGAVAVTNRFGGKTNLDRYSKNIICSDLGIDDLVRAIGAGIRLVDDRATRDANDAESKLMRDWRASFAPVIEELARQGKLG